MTRFRYGSIIESAFRIDENPYDKRIYVLKGKHARGVKLFENTVSVPRTRVSLCTVFFMYMCVWVCVLCIHHRVYILPLHNFQTCSWRRFVNRFTACTPSNETHTHTLRYTLYMTYIHRGLVRKAFGVWLSIWGFKIIERKGSLYRRLVLTNRQLSWWIIRIIISRCFVRTYIIIIYNEDEWTFRVYILAVREYFRYNRTGIAYCISWHSTRIWIFTDEELLFSQCLSTEYFRL